MEIIIIIAIIYFIYKEVYKNEPTPSSNKTSSAIPDSKPSIPPSRNPSVTPDEYVNTYQRLLKEYYKNYKEQVFQKSTLLEIQHKLPFERDLSEIKRDIKMIRGELGYEPPVQPQSKPNQKTINDRNSYKQVLREYYLQYGDEMFLPSKIQDFIESHQLNTRFGIQFDDVADDLREIRKAIKEGKKTITPIQPQSKQNKNVSTTPSQQNTQFFNTANNSMQGQGKTILREQELFDIVRTMPLLIMNESNPTSNVYINSFCVNLVNLDIVSLATSDDAIHHYEQHVANKRLRTSIKAEYHKRMENNLLFLVFEYSYMLNVFEALKGRTADTINIDYEKFSSLVYNDCRERVLQNLDREIQKTPSIKKALQSYLNNNKSYQMPNIGSISQIENDYIVFFLMVSSLNEIMQYIFKADLRNTLQMINTYSGIEIKQTLNSYITHKCVMRLSMYAGDNFIIPPNMNVVDGLNYNLSQKQVNWIKENLKGYRENINFDADRIFVIDKNFTTIRQFELFF